MTEALRERVLAASTAERRAALATDPELDAVLERVQLSAADHGIAVEPTRLAEVLAVPPEAPWSGLEVGDLYLAACCAAGDAAALRAFEASYGGELDRAIAKSPSLGLSKPEFRQLVLDRLFVREGERPPRIASYRGQGSLKAWVRVMTSRLVIDLARRVDRHAAPDDGLAEKLGAAEDTELDYLRHAYGASVDAAFEQGIGQLTVRQRNLLRQRYLHQVSPDTLAKIYAVHRSTLFVWLDRAREALLREVRAALAARMPGDQLDSVVHMLGSRLHVSVRRMLDSRLEDEAG